MSYHRFCKFAIALIILLLACGACTPEPTPTAPPIVPTETPTPTTPPMVPTETPTPTTPTETPTPVETPTPCPEVDCLPECYANNIAPAGGNGKIDSQWHATESDTWPFTHVECAARARGIIPSSLTMMTCDDAQSPTCRAVQYVYDGQQWTSHQPEQVENPYVGLPLPFSYILVSLALLGILLVGTGIVLRQRAKYLRS